MISTESVLDETSKLLAYPESVICVVIGGGLREVVGYQLKTLIQVFPQHKLQWDADTLTCDGKLKVQVVGRARLEQARGREYSHILALEELTVEEFSLLAHRLRVKVPGVKNYIVAKVVL